MDTSRHQKMLAKHLHRKKLRHLKARSRLLTVYHRVGGQVDYEAFTDSNGKTKYFYSYRPK